MFASILRKLQDFGWLLILLVLAYAAYRIIPAIDPRSGIDGFGDLFAALVLAVKGVMATILAWLCKALYWWEPSDARDVRWHDVVEHTQPEEQRRFMREAQDHAAAIVKQAQWLIVKDRVEYIAWLAFWLFVLF